MQKLIAKYGAAAHLAILAVAPLFLFPFAGDATIATSLLWLSVPAVMWMVLEPSLRRDESLHEARFRVVREIMLDPLFWTLLLILAFAGFRAINSGIGLAYDAETSKWYVSSARLAFFPGVVGDAGYLPFAAVLALTVLLQGCRHSLGKSARMSFLLVLSAMAGLAAVIALVSMLFGNSRVLAVVNGNFGDHAYVGVAFGVCFLSGTVAVGVMFERRWNWLMPLSALSVGGAAAGAFCFSPPALVCVMAIAEVILLVYSFVFSCLELEGVVKFKLLVVFGISLALGALGVMSVLPEGVLTARLSVYQSMSFLDDAFFRFRDMLTGIAFKAWLSHIWIGTGLGSFPLDFRFAATAADWALLKGGAVALANGWCLAMVERGIVGLAAILTPVGFLAFTFVRRAIGSFGSHGFIHPICWLGPLSFAAVATIGIVDGSFLRADVLMVTGPLLAVAAKGFRQGKR